jgi:hypothetical protein
MKHDIYKLHDVDRKGRFMHGFSKDQNDAANRMDAQRKKRMRWVKGYFICCAVGGVVTGGLGIWLVVTLIRFMLAHM